MWNKNSDILRNPRINQLCIENYTLLKITEFEIVFHVFTISFLNQFINYTFSITCFIFSDTKIMW